MKLKTYLSKERGRQAALAKAIGAHAPDLSRWANGVRPIPVEYGAPIERETNGAVTRKEMFPESWQRIWPELAEQAPQAPDAEQLRESQAPMTRMPPDASRELT